MSSRRRTDVRVLVGQADDDPLRGTRVGRSLREPKLELWRRERLRELRIEERSGLVCADPRSGGMDPLRTRTSLDVLTGAAERVGCAREITVAARRAAPTAGRARTLQ